MAGVMNFVRMSVSERSLLFIRLSHETEANGIHAKLIKISLGISYPIVESSLRRLLRLQIRDPANR